MIELFGLGDLNVTREQISAWLKKDDDPDYVRCTDQQFAHFLNGLIIDKRGAKDDGKKPKAEYALNNNIIFRKLKIAFNLIDQDILDLLELAGFRLGKSELTAFFRKPDHRHFRECQDQVLRNFLQGVQLKEQGTQAPLTDEQKQSQQDAIRNKQAKKKAQALKEKKAKEEAGIKGNVNPYAPKKEKVVYQNPKKKKPETEEGKSEKRPTLSLNKDIWGKKDK